MKLALAADHGGYELKELIIGYLSNRDDLELIDLGTNSCDSVDYPKYGRECAELVAAGQADRGIVFCGTGIGISIAANRIKGVRCALATNVFMAEMSRKHNNANMLALGGRVLSPEEAIAIVDVWLSTEFEGGRHQRRIDLLD
ncbi:MAG: ribose 5-phosphate isomerase B [Clostridiales bacterium]|mgnify:CR=1 FL=1|nr:ribose 5-phosphate isomerase B [Clostridiales bacterium]